VDWKYRRDETIVGSGFWDAAEAAFSNFNCALKQDNARPHICKVMMEVLSNFNVSVWAKYSPYGPDLNIIKVIWRQ
jgi:hypothetical protein